eukprot:scaffold172807_cov33-Tisochrysis_lutea.AAC.1
METLMTESSPCPGESPPNPDGEHLHRLHLQRGRGLGLARGRGQRARRASDGGIMQGDERAK